MTRALTLLLVVPMLLACGAASPTFRDAPPVWKVDDTRHIAEPGEREYDPKEYFAKIFVIKRLDRTLQIRDEELAGNINSLEEVPDSTWFQNRIGRRRRGQILFGQDHVDGRAIEIPLVQDGRRLLRRVRIAE